MDALMRRHRMQGYDALWLPGMDHAGIATQNVVERELAEEGMSRHDLGREEFIERVWEWKAESGGKILGQMRRLGDSVDWTRERFTMDDGLSRAVQTIFKRLYDDGLIYRAERIINWCPRCLTALSDIEVDHSEDQGELVSIRYGDGDGLDRGRHHPRRDHARRHRGGRAPGRRALPPPRRPRRRAAADRPRIPVVADDHVDPAFGTGAVKVTPAHDPNDFEIGRRHGLPSLTILDERGVITAPGPFEGLDRFEARPAVVAALREEGRIVAEVGRTCTRSGTARAAARRWSRGCPCSGSSRSGRWPRPPGTPCATAGSGSTRRSWRPGTSTGSTTCTTGASAASCGGATDPGLVLTRGRDGLRRAGRGAAGRRGLAPGPRRAGHLVLLGALAVLHAGLAGRHRGPAGRSTRPSCSSPATTSCSSGSPDDDVRAVRDADRDSAAVPSVSLPARPGPRQVRQEDVQVARQHGGSAGLDRPVRRDAPRFSLARGANPGATSRPTRSGWPAP